MENLSLNPQTKPENLNNADLGPFSKRVFLPVYFCCFGLAIVISKSSPEKFLEAKIMPLTDFKGAGVGFGFGVGCGFGVGWGFGGVPLNIFGLGAGGGCGVGLGLGWGFGIAYGSRYHSPGVTFQGVEFQSKSREGKDPKNLLKNN